MSGESNLLLRHEERVFGPVSLGQVRELLAAGAITAADSVREENGPWILVRDYLEWKDAANAPVADIAELLGKATPKPPAKEKERPSDPKLSAKRSDPKLNAKLSDPTLGAKPDGPASDHDPDYIPLADLEPDPGLVETKELDKPRAPRLDRDAASPGKRTGKRAGERTGERTSGRGGRPKPPADAKSPGQRGSSADVIPLAAAETRAAIPVTPSRPDRAAADRAAADRAAAERRSRNTLDNIPLPDDADLDAILRAMAAYELTAPPLKPRGGR